MDTFQGLAITCACACLQAASKDAMRAVAAIDGTPKSLLLFQGAGNVQGLFDYLLASVMEEPSTHVDVPMLIAPVPFPGSSLHQLHAQVCQDATATCMSHVMSG